VELGLAGRAAGFLEQDVFLGDAGVEVRLVGRDAPLVGRDACRSGIPPFLRPASSVLRRQSQTNLRHPARGAAELRSVGGPSRRCRGLACQP
jgi:hypothetical protein